VLHATPAQWWGTHRDSFEEWHEYRRVMRLWFAHPKFWLTKNMMEEIISAIIWKNGIRSMEQSRNQSGYIFSVTLWTSFP